MRHGGAFSVWRIGFFSRPALRRRGGVRRLALPVPLPLPNLAACFRATTAVGPDFGVADKPGDDLESFATFVRENINTIPALLVVAQRPRDLTRQPLKELALALDAKNFSERSLRAAWRAKTNQDFAASIIGYVRPAATHHPQWMVRTPPYKRVETLLGRSAGGGAAAGAQGSLAAVADATLNASLNGFERAKSDPGLGYCVYLLAGVARAALEDDYSAALEKVGLAPARRAAGLPEAPQRPAPAVGAGYSVFRLAGDFTAAVDRHLRRAGGRTDLGELAQLAQLAQLAAVESLGALATARSATLFGTRQATVQASLRRPPRGPGSPRCPTTSSPASPAGTSNTT